MTRFMVDCMTQVGTNKDHALQLAQVLIAGDLRGHYSHGLNRLGNIITKFFNSTVFHCCLFTYMQLCMSEK